MWQFEHQEIIDAPVEVVFRLISDLPNYPNWNPFLIIARGKVEMGGVISGKSVLGKHTTSYRHKIFEYIPNRFVNCFWHPYQSIFLHGAHVETLRSHG